MAIHYKFEGADETACGARGVYVNELTLPIGVDYAERYGRKACQACIFEMTVDLTGDDTPACPLPLLIHIRKADGVDRRDTLCGERRLHINATRMSEHEIPDEQAYAICAACAAER